MPGFVAAVLAVPVDQPRHQNVDDVCIDCASASGLMGSSANDALFDLEMAGIGDRLGDIEQKIIVEKDIHIGGQSGGRPVRDAVAHVPICQSRC